MSKFHILSATAVAASLWLAGIGQASAAIPAMGESAPGQEIAQALPGMDGLSAVGTGIANAPADVAVVYLNYYSNYYPQPSEDPNAPPPQPPVASAADIKPVVDAIVASGIAAADVEAINDPSTPGSFRVRAKLDKPTQARLQALVVAANGAIAKTSKFSPAGAQIGYFSNSCAALETQARTQAVADARSRATALATAAGVSLGRLSSVMEAATYGGYYGGPGCPSAADPQALRDPYAAMQGGDLLSPPVVRVNTSVSVTYEMK
jgi:Protein of unknown function (DUF541)